MGILIATEIIEIALLGWVCDSLGPMVGEFWVNGDTNVGGLHHRLGIEATTTKRLHTESHLNIALKLRRLQPALN